MDRNLLSSVFQGVALSANKLGLDNLIVMPEGTPKIKIESVKKFGGNVLLAGKDYDAVQKVAIEHRYSVIEFIMF